MAETLSYREWRPAGLLVVPVLAAVASLWIIRPAATRAPVRAPSVAPEPAALPEPPPRPARAQPAVVAPAPSPARPSAPAPRASAPEPEPATPGLHINDDITDARRARWDQERYDPRVSTQHEEKIQQTFRRVNASGALVAAQCRETLCRIVIDKPNLSESANARAAMGALGSSAAVLENDEQHIVMLLTASAIDALPSAE